MEKLWLKPGSFISTKGLPGGKLECKKGSDPLLLKDSYVKVLNKTIYHFKKSGKLLDQKAYDEFITVEETLSNNSKSDKRLALEKEALEFDLEFTDKTTQVELKALIEAKKAETVNVPEISDLDKLKAEATELEVKFDDDISVDDLALLIEDKLK